MCVCVWPVDLFTQASKALAKEEAKALSKTVKGKAAAKQAKKNKPKEVELRKATEEETEVFI